MQRTKYTIKAGDKNFRPYEPIWPVWKPGGFVIVGRIHPGGWCSREEWSYEDENGDTVLDRDFFDWQKIGGFTNALTGNANHTAMIGFAFGENPETYKLVPYINPRKGAFWDGEPMIVSSNEDFRLECKFEDGKAVFSMASEGNKSPVQRHDFKRIKIARRVGTYAGGADNSPGPYGGRAIKDMSLELAFMRL